MLTAIRSFHRPNPLANLVILQRRQPLEVSAHNRREVHRCRIIPDFFDRRRQVYHGIVLGRLRSMPRSPPRDHGNVRRHFLAGLHPGVLHFPLVYEDVSAFVDCEPRRELIPVPGNQHAHAGVPAGFLVSRGQENHVAVQMRHRTLQFNEHRQVRRQHPFVINGPASIYVSVLYHPPERIHAPPRLIHWHGIQMSHQQERPRRLRHCRPLQARHHRAPPRRQIEQFRLNSFFGQDPRNVHRCDLLVSRRIRGIDLDEVRQPAFGFFGHRRGTPHRRRIARDSRSPGWRNLRCNRKTRGHRQRRRSRHALDHTIPIHQSILLVTVSRNPAAAVNVLLQMCFILTCRCGRLATASALRCLNSTASWRPRRGQESSPV